MTKHKKLLKGIAIITSFGLITTGAVSLPERTDAVGVIMSDSFETEYSGWSTYKTNGGSCTLKLENNMLALNVTNTGTLNYSVQVGYDVVPLYKNGVYKLSYDISSTVERTVEGMIQQNGGTYQAYSWKSLNLTPEMQHIETTFTMKYDNDIMAKIVFNCGDQGDELPEHTIYLDNVTLELVDDSGVDYESIKPYESPIITNQVGYNTADSKVAVFRNITNETSFSVVDSVSGNIVYTGELTNQTNNEEAGEVNWLGDFSAVTEPGTYYIECGNLDDSYTFTISDSVYSQLLNDTVKMLYLQRCGTQIEDDTFGHEACHSSEAQIYGTSETIDVSGGWHDAGDYGRYVVPGAKTIADLLYAYQTSPSLYNDSIGIPESGNGIPDILDEVRYELEWMLKMQTSDGGVYHKVTCENFPGYIMPQYETDKLIVTPVSSTATADFCASMAMAYEFYMEYDSQFAIKCLNAAKKAWEYLESNPDLVFENPQDISTGEYGDTSDKDERYWAAAQMYRATADEKYLTALESMTVRTGLDWSTVGDYGNIALLTMENADTSSTAYKAAQNAVIKQANKFAAASESSPYGVSISSYNWGSNMTVANAGIILGLAYQLTGNENYLTAAKDNLNYLLGCNPLGYCFVTGYGTVSPENPHHRPSMAKGTAMKGMLVGGVNSNLEDPAAKAYLATAADAKCYVDHSESYSTNEITIYWNSPLIYLITLTESEGSDVLKGDVNSDGCTDLIDILRLQKWLAAVPNINIESTAADLTDDNRVDIFDLVKLKGIVSTGSESQQIITEPSTDADMCADFRKGESSEFFASNGWSNGSVFDCVWRSSNAIVKDGALNLIIDEDSSDEYNYSGGEYRTVDFYSYGYYETCMKAIKNDGVVSSFFTYTGPSDNNPWDEIDVEILGKDTTKVQFNYFTNGVGNNEYVYDLGFDASEGYHTYGFDWKEDSITWYVDGEAVYKAETNIPSTPGKIMMNVWPGTGVDSWLKPYDGTTPLTAKYLWVTYNADGHK